jgi:hypothetical protein
MNADLRRGNSTAKGRKDRTKKHNNEYCIVSRPWSVAVVAWRGGLMLFLQNVTIAGPLFRKK